MKIKYQTNFAGYFPILRAIQMLLKDNVLNFTQLGAYICLVAQADFDPRHSNYRVVIRDDIELAKEWNCSPSTVYRNRQHLISKGLLIEEDGITKVPNFFVFELEWVKTIAKFPFATIKQLFSELQEDVAQRKEIVAVLQKKQDQNGTQSSNVSSKGELNLSNQELVDIDEIIASLEDNDNNEVK